MKLLSISLALCAILTLSRANPINSTIPTISRQMGLCEYINQHTIQHIGAFVPQCDMNGNFLPQQCSGSTGYCWCVNILTGQEVLNTRTPPGVTPVNCEGEFNCPFGWSHFAGKCYIFHDTPKTWIEAEAYCLFEEANLASIHSYEENRFVQALTRIETSFPETWIGGQDAVYTSFWMWCDGSKFDFQNWFNPHSLPTDEHCLKMNYGFNWKWFPATCTESYPFVCSKRA
ncbi:Nidogen-2 [Larimichthys crocea]|uniref:Nidogen-2 n=1 Tax=Larimichthys crocea TaxID=215358 RepID=A0A6G0HK81_LARCR|nr:galactose-specific lectin nattectin [Larimichthys crocea]XP_019122615.1 galactose-specific lectin nattectin [Larimichthys crocea]XP_027143455.1 galactose-specific lectin nattectin [Larimichthys crocea]KAE8279493.1 Nidogen-2 [Larimichthys crocea]